jgi:hypothetical protein
MKISLKDSEIKEQSRPAERRPIHPSSVFVPECLGVSTIGRIFFLGRKRNCLWIANKQDNTNGKLTIPLRAAKATLLFCVKISRTL